MLKSFNCKKCSFITSHHLSFVWCCSWFCVLAMAVLCGIVSLRTWYCHCTTFVTNIPKL